MRTLLLTLLITIIPVADIPAQRKIDSIIVEITHLPTTVYTSLVMDSGGGTDDFYPTVRNILQAERITSDSMAGDTLIAVSGSGTRFKLVCNADTTLLSASIDLGNTQISLIDAPLSLTTSTFQVELDTPEIWPVKISYYRYHSSHSGSSTYTETELSSGLSAKTRLRLIFYTASTSSVGKHIPPTIVIYPNPANDLVIVRVPVYGDAVTIYDLLGRVVMLANIYDEAQVDISSLKPGVYVLRCGHESRKLVIE